MHAPESHDVTTLVLARRILIAALAEASDRYDYLSAMHEAPYDRIRPSIDDDAAINRRFAEAEAALQLFPAMLQDLEERIGSACKRLHEPRSA